MSLVEDEKFLEFLSSGSGRYQPIPIAGLYNPNAVRALGCALRWKSICGILEKDKPQKILDVGCSLGYFGIVAADAGHSVDGFDVDEEAIYWGNKVVEEFDIPNMTLRASSDDLLAELKKVPDNQYDYVFYFSLHHHMCSKLGVEKANEILQEMSRIAPKMVFDMGQSNEVDNGWLTWLKKIPQFEDHRVEIPEWVLENSGYKYAACIGESMSHEVPRLLFLFLKDKPDGVNNSKKMITMRVSEHAIDVAYHVKDYIWKDRGGFGQIHSSSTGFPVMDLTSSMRSRFYVVTDMGGSHFFMKEYLYSWLSSNKDYTAAQKTYERGMVLSEIEGIQDRLITPIALDGNMILYPFYNWLPMHLLSVEDLKHNFFDELVEIVGEIYRAIGVFDLNPNNILYNKETGEFKLIDFEPPISDDFTYRVFTNRISMLYDTFRRVFDDV